MAHLLMVESWVGSMGRLLPRAIREAGHEFTFLTRDLHHYLRSAPEGTAHPLLAARHVLTTNTNDTDALLPFVERTHDVLRFDGVITSCDYYLRTAAQISGRLGLPGPTPEAVENACRKDSTRRVLAETGLPGPRFAVCADWAEAAAAAHDIGYPLVLKPVDLCAGMFVRRADDEAALAHAYRALAAFPVNARGQRRDPVVLLEELLEGPEVSIETVSHGGAVHVIGVTDKSVGGAPAFVETGHMFPAVLDPADTEAAEETARRALKALGLDQVVAHTEIKLTADGPRLVEVNPRPAGNRITELVRHVTGIDLAAACVDVALGRAPDLRRRATGLTSAAIGFLVPDQDGVLETVDGADTVRAADGLLELQLADPGKAVKAAGSNNEYLGHVMAGDAQGPAARTRVETLLAQLRPRVVTR
ncbi:ATP-grasp domain-containing protein (plasmid) [Streptomyces sp. NBC_01591]|uniref:ATP-grasp domain-containing protein n=1 Tax=Streptomyces sp. NBC_01591 TaxID=2975888 RepID=UPI002DDC4130|nr:ATP-grasp domain-containing protein [Streptomyces sp. NBC_01591]WSD74413.1 ATP-grasp domain-containing protein [Streptomyces sp. NBC_01591]